MALSFQQQWASKEPRTPGPAAAHWDATHSEMCSSIEDSPSPPLIATGGSAPSPGRVDPFSQLPLHFVSFQSREGSGSRAAQPESVGCELAWSAALPSFSELRHGPYVESQGSRPITMTPSTAQSTHRAGRRAGLQPRGG